MDLGGCKPRYLYGDYYVFLHKKRGRTRTKWPEEEMLKKRFPQVHDKIQRGFSYWKEHPWMMFFGILFFLTLAIFLLGESSIFEQIRYSRRIIDLDRDIEQRSENFRSDSIKLERLVDKSTNLEKIAREEYKMKAPEELIFLLVDSTSQNKR